MKKNIILLLLSLCIFGCNRDHEFTFGISPDGIPYTLIIDSEGRPYIKFTGKIKVPFATIIISEEEYIQAHCTYVELYNRRENRKHVFELAVDGSKFISESKGNTKVIVERKKYSTIVKIDSEEISSYLYTGPEPDNKPRFPDHPFRSFIVTKALNSNVDWSINSLGDFIADILFGIIWILTVLLDLIILILSFLIRLILWVFILIGYAIGLV